MPVSQKAKVAVIGEFFIDEIFSEFTAFPKFGEEAFAGKFRREVGGGAGITACGLAKLGVSVKVLGTVGKADGQWVIDRLKSYGVDCSGLGFCVQEPTGVTACVSTREDRAFFRTTEPTGNFRNCWGGLRRLAHWQNAGTFTSPARRTQRPTGACSNFCTSIAAFLSMFNRT